MSSTRMAASDMATPLDERNLLDLANATEEPNHRLGDFGRPRTIR